jgi:mRNA interferase HigB
MLVAGAEPPVDPDTRYRLTRLADWRSFGDVRAVFPNADRVGGEPVFDIVHNRYLLIAEIQSTYRSVFVRQILGQAEYDQ